MIRWLLPPEKIGRRDAVTLALLAIVAFAQGWSGAAITHALPFIQDDYGISDARIFDMMTVIRAVSLLALAFSWWGDHRGRRRPLLIAFTLLPAANLLTFFVRPLGLVTALQAAARVGTLAIAALALVVLAEEVAAPVRGYAIGLYALFGSMGTGLGLLLRPLAESLPDSWRLLFALSSLPLLGVLPLARRLGESRAFVPEPTRPPLGDVLKMPHASRFWPMAGLAFAVSAFTAPAANLALVRLQNDLAWSAGSASALLAVTAAPGVLLGVLVGGRMADIAGRRPTEVVSLIIGVGGGMAFYLIDGGWMMGTGIFLSNFGAFAFGPAFAAHRAELFPTRLRATATAWITNAGVLGGIGGFAMGRFVVDSWGISTTVTVLGFVLLVASLLVLRLPETAGLSLEPGQTGPEG